ncbi:MAG: hypothetical protein HYR55_07335, partial [Acidobacteria bacterium]|nr:hypothetical protein [Acidobacteriota bacterium]
MNAPRAYYHAATLLSNGKVLITGGMYPQDIGTTTAELYDPATGVFTATGSMVEGRLRHTATLLPDGKVLIAGGFDNSNGGVGRATAELYDPVTGVFTLTGSMGTGRTYHTATLLPNGKVLAAGGHSTYTYGVGLATAELYDSAGFIPTFLLSIGTLGDGAVTSNPAGINCGTACLASFTSGQSVSLTALANTGSTFAGWSGANAVECAAGSVLMNANKSCTATFTLNTTTLTLTTAGTGSGTVSGAGTYTYNQSALVSATANTGSTFAGWSGANGTECATGSVMMNANKSCTATFTLNTYAFTLTTAGTGSGTVSGAGTYTYNQSATVSATANTGSTFAGWSGPNAVECAAGSVLMNGNKSCTATFTLNSGVTSIEVAYVADVVGNQVAVVNTATRQVIARIPVGTNPWGVTVTPDKQYVYVANNTSGDISVISTATNSELDQDNNPLNGITRLSTGVPYGPSEIVFLPNGAKAYLSNSSNVLVLNTAVFPPTILTTIPVTGAYEIAISPDGSSVYVVSITSSLVKIDTTTDQVVATYSMGVGAMGGGVAVTPDGSTVYVGADNGIFILGGPYCPLPLGCTVPRVDGPWGVAVRPDGRYVYFSANGTSTNNFLDPGTLVLDTTIDPKTTNPIVAKVPTAFAWKPSSAPNGAYLYVPEAYAGNGTNGGTLAVVDTSLAVSNPSSAIVARILIDYTSGQSNFLGGVDFVQISTLQPTITALSPATATYGVTASNAVAILGTNFAPGATITVGTLTGTVVFST